MTRGARWATAAVLAAAALAAVAALPAARSRWRDWRLRSGRGPVDVLLVTLDTTRADHLGAYGFPRPTSPHFDALARSGVLFLDASAHVPLTLPSHASLMTGLIPPRHEVRDNALYALGGGPATMAEAFVRAGYRTGAFVSAYVLNRRYGLARGFGAYQDDVLGGARDALHASVRGALTTDRALAWLAASDPRPAFLWVHLYDPHAPYEPPEPFASQFPGHPYDGEIAYADAQLGRLLKAVGERKRETLVVVGADHGEALGDHGELTHAYFIYGATQRVPLVFSLPGRLPAGVRIDGLVRLVDVMPTVLDIAGLPRPHGIDGVSLVSVMTERRRAEIGPAYLESYTPRFWWGARELIGVRTGRWLFIDAPRPELYDVQADPGEKDNCIARRPHETEELRAISRRLRGAGPSPVAEVDPEAAERVRALGYTSGTPLAPATEDLPDAKDNAPLLVGSAQGSQLMHQGRVEEALAVYRKTLDRSPRSRTLRSQVLDALLRLERHKEALPLAQELAAEMPTSEDFPVAMAISLHGLGRHMEALDLLRREEARVPGSARFPLERGRLLLKDGKVAEAEGELRRSVERAPRLLDARLRLGEALLRLGRVAEASRAFRDVVEATHGSFEGRDAGRGLMAAAVALLDHGEDDEARLAYRAAREAGQESPELYLNLFLACHRLGAGGEALAVLREGARAFPQSELIRDRLARMEREATGAPAGAVGKGAR